MATELFFFDISKHESVSTSLNDIPLISNEEAVIESVKNILMTHPGERIWEPEFGCNVDQFLFAPMDAWYANQISEVFSLAIERWEPRATNVNVEVDMNFDDLQYEVKIFFDTASAERTIEVNFELGLVR